MSSSPRRGTRLLALSALAGAGALPACGDDAATNRRCFDAMTIVRVSKGSDGASCGAKDRISYGYCETAAPGSCADASPRYACVAMGSNSGFLLELSRCSSVESLPDGWVLAEDAGSFGAVQDCKTARQLCDGTSIPWTTKAEAGGGG